MTILNKTYRIFWALLLVFTLGTTLNGLAQGNYEYVKEISVDGSQVQGSHTNFPMLIDITDADLAANVQNSNGYDIIFATDPNGNNTLDHQIESYNSGNGHLVAWVNIPTLSNSTSIYMFYGNSNVTGDPSITATWDTGFKMVQHLNGNADDATSNSNKGTRNSQVSDAAGKVGGAQGFDPRYNFITGQLETPGRIDIPNDFSLDIKQEITISAWVRIDDYQHPGGFLGGSEPASHGLISKGDYTQSYATRITQNGNLVFGTNGNEITSTGGIGSLSWAYVTLVKNQGGRHIYINGTLDNSDGYSIPLSTNSDQLQMGGNVNSIDPLDGRLDEVRISSTARSSDWITTSYKNQNNPSGFYTVGSQNKAPHYGVALTKTVDNYYPEERETVTYTITAANDGIQPVGNVKIQDNLPQGLSLKSANANQGLYNNATGTWDVGSLSTATDATLTIEANVRSGQEGNTITNTASLAGIDQPDEDASNNSDEATITVQSSGGPPPSGCRGLPTLKFKNAIPKSGGSLQEDAVYRFNGVMSGVDATVTVTDIQNATLQSIDNLGGNDDNAFTPLVYSSSGEGYVDYKIEFFDSSTGKPVSIDRFVVSAIGVHGQTNNAGYRHELVGFGSNASYTVGTNTLLSTGYDAPFDVFESQADEIDPGDERNYTEGMVAITYKDVSSFEIRGGMVNNNGSSQGAQNNFNFNSCIPDNFSGNSPTKKKKADISITKSVDTSDPGEGDTITYTLDVQNNGPKDANEVLIKDQLPGGLIFESSNPSQGSYDENTGEWNVGELGNGGTGGTAKLTITATVNQGTAGNTINNIARIDALNQSDPNGGNQQSNAEITVASGVEVSGKAFADANHNGISESGESGIDGVTMVLHNTKDGSCQSVQTDGSGNYTFANVSAGDYKLIEAANNSGNCPPTAADPGGYVSTTPNSQPITVNNNPVTHNFGDFEGSKVEGKVFNDNGVGSNGTANNIVQDGSETGISGITIKANDGSGNTRSQVTTTGSGSYQIYLADADFGNNSTVVIKEINNSTLFSVGAKLNNTDGSYNRQKDKMKFTVSSGSIYTELLFSDVKKSLLFTDGKQNIMPGSSGVLPHKFTAKTDGTLSLSTQSNNNPSSNDFNPVIYQDDNCNQSIDSGESILTPSDTITMTKGQTVCLLRKVIVPQAASNDDTGNITLIATFSLANTDADIQQSVSRTDVINVTDSNTGLSLTKSVDKSKAKPGDPISYTITYMNNGKQPINSLKITDNIPAYTTYKSSSCNKGSLPDDLTKCEVKAPVKGKTGTITWSFTGSLQPGKIDSVHYQVKIQD